MRLTLGLGLLVLLSRSAYSQVQTTEIFVGGNKVGEAVYEEQKDGTFKSDMSLAVSGVTVESHLKGTYKNGNLDECELSEGQGTRKGRIVWKDDKMSTWQGDKQQAKDIEVKFRGLPFFATYHIQLWKTVLAALDKQGGAGDLSVINISGFSPTKFTFERRISTVQIESGAVTATILKTEVSGIGMEIAFDETGKPLGLNVPSQTAQFVLKGYAGVFVDPLSKYPELSQPTFKVKRMTRVRSTMGDGARLMSEIAMPDIEGKYPTVLVRTPYGRKASLGGYEWLVKRGYVVVSQDVRGRGGSDGDWDPLVHERSDGNDTLNWIAQQEWSNGKVGMIGGSYLGYVQWSAATTGNPVLKCIIPQVSPPPPDRNFPWDHGAFMLLPDVWWCRVVIDREANMTGIFDSLKNLDALKTKPIGMVDDKYFGRNVPFFDKWVRRTELKDWNDVFTLPEVAKVKIPVLHVSGVWDGDGVGTMLHWAAQRSNGGNQWVVFGPWTHLFNSSTKVGETNYGADSVLELESVYLRFFDTYLKDKQVAQEAVPRVKFFMTGANKWIEGSDWPLPNAKPVTYFLSGGKAVGKGAKGQLSATPGKGGDTYDYDPNNVLFKAKEIEINPGGGSMAVPKSRLNSGTLLYRSEAFTNPTALAGPMNVELYVSTTAKDATFHVLVMDEDEKGQRLLIAMPGTRRLTWSDGTVSPVTPGRVYQISLEPWWFAREFGKGHRLAIMVYSDNFPQFARNPGTGVPEWKATKYVKAKHTVWKDAAHPSKVTLWTIEK